MDRRLYYMSVGCATTLAVLAAAGCAAPIKPPPLPPSASAPSASAPSASAVKPASYSLPDGTKVHDVKCSCCQH